MCPGRLFLSLVNLLKEFFKCCNTQHPLFLKFCNAFPLFTEWPRCVPPAAGLQASSGTQSCPAMDLQCYQGQRGRLHLRLFLELQSTAVQIIGFQEAEAARCIRFSSQFPSMKPIKMYKLMICWLHVMNAIYSNGEIWSQSNMHSFPHCIKSVIPLISGVLWKCIEIISKLLLKKEH